MKSIFLWLLILSVAIFMPCITFAQESAGSNNPSQDGKSAVDSVRQTGDSSKGFTPENAQPSRGEQRVATATVKGETLSGKVVHVIDGDTLVLQVKKTKYNIRLLGIDAPENEQPFGKQAAKALADRVLEKMVQVETYGKDSYGNTLGIVNIDGKNVNLEMVKQGLAWRQEEYSDSKVLAEAEDEAKKAKIGLWADKNPISPWQWRSQTNADSSADPFAEKGDGSNADKTTTSSDDQTQKYWLTASSNVRHNSKCRYYQKTKGRACGPNEGKACKICGG